MQNIPKKFKSLATRFRRLLPVIVDVETTGLNPTTDGLLEIAAVTLVMNERAELVMDKTYTYHIEPFIGANVNPEALLVTGINPDQPLRYAISEQQALHMLFSVIDAVVKNNQCQRAVLIGHNAWFDLAFIQAAAKRCDLQSRNPFHSFTSLDTATLSAVALGETVLARALKAAKIPFDIDKAHAAIYDAEKTAELFCYLVNSRFGNLV